MPTVPDSLAPLSPPAAPRFRATVHGLAFADRARHLRRLEPGGELVMIPDPPGGALEQVWLHLRSGDPVGHLPNEIGSWLAPWMRGGGRTRARVVKVGDASVPSWKRLLVEVTCLR
ncbi:MAG: hypothetical protein ACE5HP_11770 [Gemmatimonadota bacterium]